MAGGTTPGARELDQTPTWAVSAVCAGIIVISIILEKVLHLIGEFFQKRKKKALFEALDKVKNELMVLGFISLLLTFGQNYISKFCVPARFADTMLPCPIGGNEYYMKTHGPASNSGHQPPSGLHEPGASPHPPAPVHETGPTHDPPAAEVREPGNVPSGGKGEHRRRLLWFKRRSLAGGAPTVGCKQGYLPLISVNGLHQLHIFIFFLAVFHVIYSCITMALGKLKIRGWKDWEKETVRDHEMLNDPARFRLTHETSFVKGHNSFWTKTPVLFYIVCFLRQFSRSVRRADYLTMRHGFISVHLAPGSKFDFQKYIKRSLEDDFKVVVGISPLLWASVVLFLLMNVDGWQAMFWISVLPLVVTLAVGTKLQAIIAKMALEIQEKHAVVQGIPLVQVSDRNFWFSWPPLVLYLIHFVLFQNAFEITYFFWIWYEFGLESCFHSNFTFVIVRVCLGIGAQFLCSYSTLPLYALVTQMGSTMKRSVFDEQTSKALKQWHQKAVKKKTEEGTEMRTRVLGGSPGDSPMDSPSNHRHPNSTSVGVELSDIDAHTASPHRTANIVASVDLPGDQQLQRNDNSEFPDLLTGP